jgi:aminopeptidase N
VPDAVSLTQEEAAARGDLLRVDRYDIEVDLRGLLGGEVLRSAATITFTCREPGAASFVDCAAEVQGATLNGAEIDLSAVRGGRIPLADLAADNVLVVHATQSDTTSGAGVRRTVDASDGLVYVWTSFEPDEARRLWACFDQPDLKAPHAFVVHAPTSWTVLSNRPPADIANGADGADGWRTWTFPDTPPLSTYVVVVNAGPYHEIRSRRGGHDLGLYCRQSLREVFERDAEELFTLTAQGLAFFGGRFGSPFPQERYDQVFAPNMGGAMENWGCVTWGDGLVSRSTPTYADRSFVAYVLLHEMAHMWFGDLVTMRWWDDLWLNEAFASWASDWAMAGATEFTDAWASFLVQRKLLGYRNDMGPASHPIRAAVPDVARATANFDAITYDKGESVLKQLAAYVGEDVFVAGLRTYFDRHSWGSARLDDLVGAVAEASGRDLAGWTEAWLDRAGADTLVLADGVLTATSPDAAAPRPHRLDVGCFSRVGDTLTRTAAVDVETTGEQTAVDLPDADLYVVNDRDLTYAAVRTDAAGLEALLAEAGSLPDPVSRAVAIGTGWDMMAKGELAPAALLESLLGALDREDSTAVAEPFLVLAQQLVERWCPPSRLADNLARLAEAAAAMTRQPDLRAAALRTLAVAATSDEHFLLLDRAAEDDHALAWRVLARRAELDRLDEAAFGAAVDALLEVDPDPDASARALAARAARPLDSAKAVVWVELFEKRSVPSESVPVVAEAFWRPGQTELLLPWAHRFFDEAEHVRTGGMLAVMSLIAATYPTISDEDVLVRARAAADTPDVLPPVRSRLLTGADTMARVLRARHV